VNVYVSTVSFALPAPAKVTVAIPPGWRNPPRPVPVAALPSTYCSRFGTSPETVILVIESSKDPSPSWSAIGQEAKFNTFVAAPVEASQPTVLKSSLTSSITLETQLADSTQIFSNSFSTIDPLYEVLSTSTSYNTSYPLTSDSVYEDEFGYLDVQIANYQKKYPHLSIDEIFMQIGDLDAPTSEEAARTGQVVDVTKLSPKEIIFLANSVDDINKFEALEHIRSTYVSSAPNVKLYYPEPFIASASFIHNDIGFIHILQYQF
jgi:hypothetical protein